MFCDPEQDPWVEWSAKLLTPVPLTDSRRVRKLLEATAEGAYLVSDSVHVFGVGRPSNDALVRYFARFQGGGRWAFSSDGKLPLLESSPGGANMPAERLRHGTIVVVTSDDSEVERLGVGSFRISPPRRLTADETLSLTSMDGALLLDTGARCHAFAVILDGKADATHGDPGRGARFNSAERYLAEQRRKGVSSVAVVVSEDGGVDLL
jgi:hypothetical protein